MLTKEECLNSLEDLYIEAKNAGITYEYVIEDANKMLTQLINEHFELLEKYQNLQDENARLSFDKIVNNIEDMGYKLWLENPPLKFEELKEGMWIWDNQYKDYVKFERHDIDDVVGKVLILSKGFDDECLSIFRENRYFRKQVE